MMKHPIAAACLAAGLVLSSPPPARALFGLGDTVFDPSNYAQNVLTAARALEQINNQIQSLQNQAAMLQNMARNLKGLDHSSLGQLLSALNRIDGLLIEADGLGFNLSRLESQWQAQYPETYNATITSNDIAGAARERWRSAMDAFRQTMRMQSQIVENLEEDQDLLADLVGRSQGAAGALQAQQAANQLIALTAKQQMQIQALMAAQYRAEAHDAARKAQAEEAARERTRRFLGTGKAYPGD